MGKTFRVGEKFNIQMKVAAYNLTNRLNRADPDMSVTSGNFGKALNQANGLSGRQLEAVLKITF